MMDNSSYYEGRRVTIVGLFGNIALFFIKLLAGIYGNSQALLADAVHTLSDLATDTVVLLGLKFSNKPRDEEHPYGHEKIETLSTLAVGAILIYVALKIGLNAGKSIYAHESDTPSVVAVGVAAVSIVVKEVLFRYTLRVGMKIRSQSVMANAWHHRSDAFSSIAILVGVSAAVFIPSLRILDAYAALIVAFIIVKVGTEIGLKAAREIVDTAPRHEVRERIGEIILSIDGILLMHDLRTRYFGKNILADVHIEVNPGISVSQGHIIATEAKEAVISAIPEVMNLLVHVEPAGDFQARHLS